MKAILNCIDCFENMMAKFEAKMEVWGDCIFGDEYE